MFIVTRITVNGPFNDTNYMFDLSSVRMLLCENMIKFVDIDDYKLAREITQVYDSNRTAEKIFKDIIKAVMEGEKVFHLPKKHKTFRDFYEYIQIAKIDEYGLIIINDNIAFHIYSDRKHLNVCEPDKYGGWVDVTHFSFLTADNIVKVKVLSECDVIDYENEFVYSMDDSIIYKMETRCGGISNKDRAEYIKNVILSNI